MFLFFLKAIVTFNFFRFLLFSLLVPFVHREGSIGQQARDALLLCMSMSNKNELVASYITEYSNVCPVSDD